MVKLLFVCGSPRKASTAYAMEEARKGAESVEQVRVDMLYLQNRKIAPCIHCDACIRKETPGCVLYHDDMEDWNQRFFTYDGVLIGTAFQFFVSIPFGIFEPTAESLPADVPARRRAGGWRYAKWRAGNCDPSDSGLLPYAGHARGQWRTGYLCRRVCLEPGSFGGRRGGRPAGHAERTAARKEIGFDRQSAARRPAGTGGGKTCSTGV